MATNTWVTFVLLFHSCKWRYLTLLLTDDGADLWWNENHFFYECQAYIVVTTWSPTILWAFGYGLEIWPPQFQHHTSFVGQKIEKVRLVCPIAFWKKVGSVQLHHHLVRCLGFGVSQRLVVKRVHVWTAARDPQEGGSTVTYKKRKGPEIHVSHGQNKRRPI